MKKKGRKIYFKAQKCNSRLTTGQYIGSSVVYNIYSDLPLITDHKTILYGDDSIILFEGISKLDIENDMNRTLSNVVQWLVENNLNINLTSFITFQNCVTLQLIILFRT